MMRATSRSISRAVSSLIPLEPSGRRKTPTHAFRGQGSKLLGLIPLDHHAGRCQSRGSEVIKGTRRNFIEDEPSATRPPKRTASLSSNSERVIK